MNKANPKKNRDLICKIFLIVLLIAVIVIEVWYRTYDSPTVTTVEIYNSISRLSGAAVAIIFMIEFSFGTILDFRGNGKPKSLLFILPAILVAANNFPWMSFFTENCSADATFAQVILYALSCICVGLFEETAFRGCVLMMLMKKRINSKMSVFMAIFWSSVIFGAVHLVNIFTSSPGAVLLQIGYSSLIGAMCSLVLLETKNIWLCVFVHALYNFAGGFIPRFGNGVIWTGGEIVLTSVIGIAVVIYSVWRFFFSMPLENAKDLFEDRRHNGKF